MTLDAKLTQTTGGQWTKALAVECWHLFHKKYEAKHYTALHHAMMGGNVDMYTDREAKTFERYARMFIYQRLKESA